MEKFKFDDFPQKIQEIGPDYLGLVQNNVQGKAQVLKHFEKNKEIKKFP